MQNVENNDVVEIDLMEIFSLMLHRMWLILLCAVAAGAVGYVISRYVLTEEFQSTTRIYVLNRQNDDMLTYSDVQLGSQLTKDFTQIIKSRYVLEQVIDICGIEDTSASLASRVNVDTQTDTRIVTITVTDTEPAMAQYIANELREAAAERIMYVMDIQAVNVVDEADLPTSPSAPSVTKWTAICFLLGASLCMVVVLIQFLLDDTVKTSDDIEKYLGLSTLGMIPIREEREGRDHDKGSHSSGNRECFGEQQDSKDVGYSQGGMRNSEQKKKSEEPIASADMPDKDGGYNRNSEEDSYAED